MLKAYKYRIYPNSEQALLIEKHFGCSRFVFNWALALQKRYYAIFGKSLSRNQIQSQLVKKKKTGKFAWLNEVNSQSLLNALLNVYTAFTNFFKGRAKFPRFKSKKILGRSYQCPQHCTVNFEQGISHLLNLSDGSKFDNPKHLANASKRLAVQQKIFARKQKQSKNYLCT